MGTILDPHLSTPESQARTMSTNVDTVNIVPMQESCQHWQHKYHEWADISAVNTTGSGLTLEPGYDWGPGVGAGVGYY